MTCIVGLISKKDKSVVIGADSAGIANWDISIRKDPKVFFVNEYLIGGTSSFRMLQLLRYTLKIPEIGSKELYEFMCTDFVDAIRSCFESGGYLQKTQEGDEKGGTFLVGYKNRLFEVGNDFQVAEHTNGMYSIGVGFSYALGSLYSTRKSTLTPKERVKEALEAACEFSIGVAKPILIYSTKDNQNVL